MELKSLMKIVFVFIIMVLQIGGTDAYAQSQDETVKKISEAFNNKSADSLSIHFFDRVDVIFPENNGIFSKKQVHRLLHEFFKKQGKSSFEIEFKGFSDNETYFCIGDFKTDQKNYSIYLLIKKRDKKFLIHQLQIEEEKE